MALHRKVMVALGLTDKTFSANLKAAESKLMSSANRMNRQGRRLSIQSREIFMGMTLPMLAFGKGVFDATAKVEQLEAGLRTIAGSKGLEGMEDMIKQTQELAKLPGLGLDEVFSGVTDLVALNVPFNETRDIIEGLGIGIARAGGSAAEFDRVMTQVTQGISKGKLEMKDFKTIFEQMPEARGLLETVFGTSDLDALRKAGVTAQQAISAIATEYQKLGSGNLANSFANQLDNIRDSAILLGSTLGKKIFSGSFKSGMASIAGTMDNLRDSINSLSPQAADLILRFTKFAATILTVAPAVAFLRSRFMILGAMLLKMSSGILAPMRAAWLSMGSVVRILGLTMAKTGLMATNFRWKLVALQLTSVKTAKSLLTLRGATMAVGTGFKFVGKMFVRFIPIIGQIWLAVELLSILFPKLGGALKKVARIALDWISSFTAVKWLLDKLGKAFEWVSEKVSDFASGGSHAGSELNRISVKAKDTGDSFEYLGDKIGDASDKLKEMWERSNKRLNSINATISAEIDASMPDIHDETSINYGALPKLPMLDAAAQESWNQSLESMRAGVARVNGEVQLLGESFEENANQKFAQGAEIAGHFGGAMGALIDGMAGAIDAGKNFGQEFRKILLGIFKQLIAVIAKMLVFKAITAILTGGGSVAVDALGSGAKGFLSGLGGALGVPSFSSGGIIGSPMKAIVGDNPTSPEVVAPLHKLPNLLAPFMGGAGGQGMRLSGSFRIDGRDLVYIVEENQQMLSTVR